MQGVERIERTSPRSERGTAMTTHTADQIRLVLLLTAIIATAVAIGVIPSL